MITGKKAINDDLIYTHFKRHYCPYCMIKLNRIKCSKVVNSKSLEAKDFDFELGNVFLAGDVKFIWTEFQCPKCNRQFTISQMKQFEKDQKKV